jgi:cyclohexyl-isocyanide hydratase
VLRRNVDCNGAAEPSRRWSDSDPGRTVTDVRQSRPHEKEKSKMSIRIGFPLYETFDSLDVLGPYQAFTYSNFTPLLVAQSASAVTSLEGVHILPTTTFTDCGQLDVLFVPGGSDFTKVLNLGPRGSNCYLDFLEEQARSATMVCSVCTGALLLGAAGLLDGCITTTHWAFKDVLRLFPCTVVDDYRRYVQSGNRVTGAGISSGLDEALYLISVLEGTQSARRSQLAMQYRPDPIFHCGDPGQPDIRDQPQLPDEIKSDWRVADTLDQFRKWLANQ